MVKKRGMCCLTHSPTFKKTEIAALGKTYHYLGSYFMGKYIVKRLLLTIVVILGAAVVIFTVMFFVPGDPVEIILGGDASLEDIALKREELGLNDPYIVQLANFLYDAIHLDFGTSWVSGGSVMKELLNRLPRTFLLGALTVLVTVVVGIPVGVSAAINRGSWRDRITTVISMFLISVPEFWLALMLILVFSLYLNLLPSFGIESWTCYILPVVSGAAAGTAVIIRQTRASVLEVIRADYITTARAKGMSERNVIYQHMLPNALIPIITVAGGNLTRCVGGTLVLERIFSFPGIGLYISDAISARDYPVIRGGVIMIAAFTAILMLFVDLAYGFVDPQIKAQYTNSGKSRKNTGIYPRNGRSAKSESKDCGMDSFIDGNNGVNTGEEGNDE